MEPLEHEADLQESDSSWSFDSASACNDAFAACDPSQSEGADRVFTLEHLVSIGGGNSLYVKEFFSLASWLNHPRRAVLFLNGGVFQGNCWNIPVPGYDGPEMVARRGMFAYTVDYLGTGRSSSLENAHNTSVEKSTEAARTVLETIHSRREVPGVDLIGEGYGGIIACQLAADPSRVRKCVLISMAYKDVASGPTRSPEVIALLTNSPDGYFPVPPEAYDPFMSGAPREVQDHIRSTQAGRYPVHVNLLAHGEPPIFDASVARVPGLILFGARDFVVGPRDPYDLAEDYGTAGALLEVNDEAGHAPRIESPETASWLWSQIFDFIQ